MRRELLYVFFVLAVLSLEEYIKGIAALCVTPCDSIATKFLKISILFSRNTGFSLGVGEALPSLLNAGLPFLLIVAVCAEGIRSLCANRAAYQELLIVSGGCANLYDRLVHGAVRDYLAVVLWGYEMPIINMGDILIVVGVALFLIRELSVSRRMQCSK
jgi:lipoprotein signal peptidase